MVRGPLGYGLWGRMGGMTVRRLRAMRTPEQQMVDAAAEQEKVNDIVSKQDARYDSMTEEEREQYYMKPSLTTRIKKALRGQ
jgi:hypothetical protein